MKKKDEKVVKKTVDNSNYKSSNNTVNQVSKVNSSVKTQKTDKNEIINYKDDKLLVNNYYESNGMDLEENKLDLYLELIENYNNQSISKFSDKLQESKLNLFLIITLYFI